MNFSEGDVVTLLALAVVAVFFGPLSWGFLVVMAFWTLVMHHLEKWWTNRDGRRGEN